MGYLLAFLYGVALAFTELSFDDWQFWALFILFFCGRFLGYWEGSNGK